MTAFATKAYKGIGMEGHLAHWYVRTTRNDMPQIAALAADIAAKVPIGATVLEIAPGPGFLSIELAKRGFNVRAVDISKTFVEITRRNAAAANVTAEFDHGDAAMLPVLDESVDFVVCRAAFKNFTRPVAALAEMRRVLRPNGTALLIDMRRDAPGAELKRYVDGTGVSWLERQILLLTFHLLIKRAYLAEDIRRMANEAGWITPRIDVSPIGFAAWMDNECS